MVGDNPRRAQFFQNLRWRHGLNSGPGITTPANQPARYQNNPAAERIYRAQFSLMRDFDAGDDSLPAELRFKTVEEVQEYCDNLMSWEWSRWRHGPSWQLTVKPTHLRMFTYGWGVLSVPVNYPHALRELHIIHEVGHHLSMTGDHSLAFVKAMLDVLGTAMDPRASERFKHYLTQEGVQHA